MMNTSKRKITFKVFISYAAISILAVIAGKTILGEIKKLTEIKSEQTQDTAKILQIGNILTLMYEGETMGRVAIQSEDQESLEEYLKKNETLHNEIILLKNKVATPNQKSLLDSVSALVDVKISNIRDLRKIRNDDSAETGILDAIQILSNLENYMGRLTIENFVANPDELDKQTRENLKEYLKILSKYTPTEAPSKEDRYEMDSIILTSKSLLKKIHLNTASQKRILKKKENELMENDLAVSKQLKSMLTQLELDVLKTAKEVNASRNAVLEKSRYTLTGAAFIGVLLIIIFSIVILNDFWKAQHLREKLERANQYSNSLLKSRDHLISMVSHDLKTPLNTIIGYTELISKSIDSPKENHYLDHIKNASRFVSQLVDELLDYSKLEAGKVQIEKVPFQLVELVEETALSIQSIYPKKEIDLFFEIANNCNKTFVGDSYRIKQILYNLIGNAYKFTENGSITIGMELSETGNNLTIYVADTGIGIADEKQQLIFEEFQQAEDNTVKKFGGSGLGLHISKKLALLMDGDLNVKSKLLEGSTFTLTIPATFTTLAVPLVNANENAEVEKLPSLRALVIDDDETLLQLSEELLTGSGILVETFTNGKIVLENISKLTFDFIITDIQLPEMNGFHFVEMLHQKGINKPIIAVTGRKDMPENFYTENGFTAVLFKPYKSEDLLHVICSLFSDSAVIPKKNVDSTVPTNTTSTVSETNFNLKSIAGFVGNDDEALAAVIKLYVKDTTHNIEKLNIYYTNKNYKGISDLSHRMLTMLKQFQIVKETEILLQLEKAAHLDDNTITALMNEFNKHINITLQQLKAYYESKP
ncbi:hybrid sensor histidine kinase/response regulator [Neptunitalea chrysea]|uniref:histidine kinase n=1 Tax=Neptunitalea chrysea TaxID=1647581 RepID=A0A9W6B894_9FLAO|nr:ATP-binding protein [Neptunitalea chrysea]GLB52648.1 hybrid sensor histidine kinase/response regulator [Neptunitalea chrysea]